jgi:hypothetical protein
VVGPEVESSDVTRSSFAGLAVASGVCFAIALAIVGVIYSASPMSVLHDVASAARMPVPGTRDADLDARSYGLYFGASNAPTGKAMRVPKLSITIVPPKGVRDPQFVREPYKVDVLVGGFHTVQVATITVAVPGRYHVHVESPDESGGSFSIGEPPALKGFDYGLVQGSPFIVLFVGLSIAMMVAALVARRRQSPAKR